MHCLYCGKKLSMIQRLTEGEFCSTAHRKLFDTEEREITAARLRQSRELGQLAGFDGDDPDFLRSLTELEPNGKLAPRVPYVPVRQLVTPALVPVAWVTATWTQPPWRWPGDVSRRNAEAANPFFTGTAHDPGRGPEGVPEENMTVGGLTPGLPPMLATGSRPWRAEAPPWEDPSWYTDSGLAPVADDTGRFRASSRPLFDPGVTAETRLPTAFDPYPAPLIPAARTDEFALPEPLLLDLTRPALEETLEMVAPAGALAVTPDAPEPAASSLAEPVPLAVALPSYVDVAEPVANLVDPAGQTQVIRPVMAVTLPAEPVAEPEPAPAMGLQALSGASAVGEAWKYFRLVADPMPVTPRRVSPRGGPWAALMPAAIDLYRLQVPEPVPSSVQAFGLTWEPLRPELPPPIIFTARNNAELSPQTRVSNKIFRLGVGSGVDIRLIRDEVGPLSWGRKPAVRPLRLSMAGDHRRGPKKGIGETLLPGAIASPKATDAILSPLRQMRALWNAAPADLRWAGLIVPVMVGALFGVALLNQGGEPVKSSQARVAREEEAPQVELPPAPGTPLPQETASTHPLALPAPEALGVTVRKPTRQMANVLDRPVIAKKTDTADESTLIGPEASPSGPPAEPWKQDLQVRWVRLMDKIQRRAAVAYVDDFRSGLSNWAGPRDWARTWSYDHLGFIRPGTLAVYEPSMVLEDYRMEFLALPEKQSVTWAYRVMDWKNYYASRLVVMEDDGVAQFAIEHWAVIDGRVSKFERKSLPASLRPESFCRLRLEVRGDSFAVWLQGNLIDHWTDSRLTAGGVGFLSAKGASAKIRWMEVSHQYDVLGRLCASLVPAGTRIRNGG